MQVDRTYLPWVMWLGGWSARMQNVGAAMGTLIREIQDSQKGAQNQQNLDKVLAAIKLLDRSIGELETHVSILKKAGEAVNNKEGRNKRG